MKLVYPAIFTKDNETYDVVFPDLGNIQTYGDSIENAIYMATDLASVWLLDMLEDGKDIPKSTNIKDITVGEDSFVSLIRVDLEEYAKLTSRKVVKKNCTLPYWLEQQAEKRGYNFSRILQEAILDKINNEV